MRWIPVMAVLAGVGLLACGSDGGGAAGPLAGSEPSEGSEVGAEEVERDAPPDGVDSTAACPAAGEVGDRAGEPIEVWDLAINDGTFVAECTYESEDRDLHFQVLCLREDDVEAAQASLAAVARNNVTTPYAVGDEGLIQDDSFTDNGSGDPVVGEKATVRHGDVVCDGSYNVLNPRGGEVSPEVKATLEYLMTTLPG